MTQPVGIDISEDQTEVPPGDWLFVVHKATEGHDYEDPAFDARFAPSRAVAAYVGAYHYARPLDGNPGDAQADFFANTLLSQGFRPGEDLWQLDCEGTNNVGTSSSQWEVFVRAFMDRATTTLGNRGFLYVGAYFDPVFVGLRTQYNWWDPDYGPNDGAIHPLPSGISPVIHQYTSIASDGQAGLDKNVIADLAKWNAIVGDVPANPGLIHFLKWVASFAKKPLLIGANGNNVKRVQGLLNRHGFHLPVNGKYDTVMAAAVKRFKIAHGISNSNGNVVGATCLAALIK